MLGSLDLYTLFVDQVFGGLLLAIIGLGIVFALIMILGRLSKMTILSILVYYALICGLFASVLTFVLIFFLTMGYLTFSIVNWFSGGRN